MSILLSKLGRRIVITLVNDENFPDDFYPIFVSDLYGLFNCFCWVKVRIRQLEAYIILYLDVSTFMRSSSED